MTIKNIFLKSALALVAATYAGVSFADCTDWHPHHCISDEVENAVDGVKDFATNPAKAISSSVEKIKQNVNNLPSDLANLLTTNFGQLSANINPTNLLGCAAAVGFSVANAAEGYISGCTAPGIGTGSTTTGNSCGDAAASAVLAIGLCSDLSDDKKGQAAAVLELPEIQNWMRENQPQLNQTISEVSTHFQAALSFDDLFSPPNGWFDGSVISAPEQSWESSTQWGWPN